MTCKKCQGKGFVESWRAEGAAWSPIILQCPERCDISGYSNEVQRRLSNPSSERQPMEQIQSRPRARLRLVE